MHASSPLRKTDTDVARLLSAAEVAELLGLAPRTVKQLAHDGRLPRVVIGRRSTRYRLQDVLALIDDCTHDEAPVTSGTLARTPSPPAHEPA